MIIILIFRYSKIIFIKELQPFVTRKQVLSNDGTKVPIFSLVLQFYCTLYICGCVMDLWWHTTTRVTKGECEFLGKFCFKFAELYTIQDANYKLWYGNMTSISLSPNNLTKNVLLYFLKNEKKKLCLVTNSLFLIIWKASSRIETRLNMLFSPTLPE